MPFGIQILQTWLRFSSRFWHKCQRSWMKHRRTDLFLCTPVKLGMHFQCIQHQRQRFGIWTNVSFRICSWVSSSVGKLLLKHEVLHVTSSMCVRAISSSTMLLSLQSGPNFTWDPAFQPITYCCRGRKFLLDFLQRSTHVHVPVDGEKSKQQENSSRMISNCVQSWVGLLAYESHAQFPDVTNPGLNQNVMMIK